MTPWYDRYRGLMYPVLTNGKCYHCRVADARGAKGHVWGNPWHGTRFRVCNACHNAALRDEVIFR